MINAWSLAGSILNGTFEKDYPIMDKSKGRWSEDDQIRELDDYCEDSVISPFESDEYDILTTQSSAAHFPSASKTASSQTDLYDGGIEELISTRRLVHILRAYSIFRNKAKAIQVCINRFDDETKQSFMELYDKVDADFEMPENNESVEKV